MGFYTWHFVFLDSCSNFIHIIRKKNLLSRNRYTSIKIANASFPIYPKYNSIKNSSLPNMYKIWDFIVAK